MTQRKKYITFAVINNMNCCQTIIICQLNIKVSQTGVREGTAGFYEQLIINSIIKMSKKKKNVKIKHMLKRCNIWFVDLSIMWPVINENREHANMLI